jgi:hypothetical protein
MTRRSTALTAALITAALAVSGCGSEESTSPAAAPSSEAPDSFEAVLEAAKGQTVDWYMYGGDDRLNGYVNGYVKDRLAELDITLNQVKINDTAEAVNKVLGEKTAGKDEDGSVDLIWINGENFATLKQADAVRCGYVDMLPSAQYVDLEGPGIATDFGTPTEGCEVPWQQATSSLVYDSTALTEEDTASVESLFAWAEANPAGSPTQPSGLHRLDGGPHLLLRRRRRARRLRRGLRRAGLPGSRSRAVGPAQRARAGAVARGQHLPGRPGRGAGAVRRRRDRRLPHLRLERDRRAGREGRAARDDAQRRVRRRQHRQLQLHGDPVQRR